MAERKKEVGGRWLHKDGTHYRIMKINPKTVQVRDRDGNLKTINPETLVTYVKG